MTDPSDHWAQVYAARATHEVSWYQIRPETSLKLIANLGIQPDDAVIDVGGGASNLVDHLLEQGFTDVTVLDISTAALSAVKVRLGKGGDSVHWLAGDINHLRPQGPYRLWHDRAVFHFLTAADDRRTYLATLSEALPRSGFAIMATFAEDGPERCSNLPVRRYSPDLLAAELGQGFELIQSLRETHVTPAQGEQKFIYGVFRRCLPPAANRSGATRNC